MHEQYKCPCIYEYIGLPGVGKTTLLHAICNNNPKVKSISPLPLWNYRSLFRYLESFPSLTRILLRSPRKDICYKLKPPDILSVTKLIWWKKHIIKMRQRAQDITIIDEGPVGLLSWSLEFGSPPYTILQHSSFFEQYFDFIAQSYAAVIVLIIQPGLALERIRQRNPKHWICKMPDNGAFTLLNRIAHGQTKVVAMLASRQHEMKIINIHVEGKSTVDLLKEMSRYIHPCHLPEVNLTT